VEARSKPVEPALARRLGPGVRSGIALDTSRNPMKRIKIMATSCRPRWFPRIIEAAIALSLVAVLVALVTPAVLEARRSARASATT
jgi:hypothetical protein